MNSVSDIYGPDEIEELLEDLNRLEMASFDGVMMFDQASMPPDPDDLLGMRPTSSEMNIMQNEAVISGCITQPPDDDVEDFDIDGSQVRRNKISKIMCLTPGNVSFKCLQKNIFWSKDVSKSRGENVFEIL